MSFPQPPFQSQMFAQNNRFNSVWQNWFQQVQAQLSYQGSPVIDGGYPDSVYGGSVTAINGGTVSQSGTPV